MNASKRRHRVAFVGCLAAVLGLVSSTSAGASASRTSGTVSMPDVLSVDDAAWMSDVFALTSKYPSKFGGVRFDANLGTFTVFTTESQSSAQALLVGAAQAPTLAAERPNRIKFVQSSTTYENLLTAQQQLTELISAGKAPFSAIEGWGPNDNTGNFRIGVTQTPTAEQVASLSATLGVKIEIDKTAPSTNSTRLADRSPFIGGARMNTDDGHMCTTGFAVVRSGANRLLSAGHCSGSAMRTGDNQPIGSVTERSFSANQVDAELVSIPALNGSIYAGGVTSSTILAVKGIHILGTGDRNVCFSGSVTGEKCGGTVEIISQCHSTGGVVSCGIADTNNSISMSTGGDSGGPVYVKVTGGVQASAIIKGEVTGTNRRYVTQIQSIQSKYPLTVATR